MYLCNDVPAGLGAKLRCERFTLFVPLTSASLLEREFEVCRHKSSAWSISIRRDVVMYNKHTAPAARAARAWKQYIYDIYIYQCQIGRTRGCGNRTQHRSRFYPIFVPYAAPCKKTLTSALKLLTTTPGAISLLGTSSMRSGGSTTFLSNYADINGGTKRANLHQMITTLQTKCWQPRDLPDVNKVPKPKFA